MAALPETESHFIVSHFHNVIKMQVATGQNNKTETENGEPTILDVQTKNKKNMWCDMKIKININTLSYQHDVVG